MNFSRQNRIYNPENQKSKIVICGVGSVGSFVALTLAKMGMSDITCIDFDKVESHNIPNQFYREKDIGKFKVDALKEIVKDFTGVDINVINSKIDEGFEFDLSLDTIVILGVDTIEVRKLIYNKLEEMPVTLCDIRFGGEGFIIYNIDLGNDEHKKRFEKSLTATAKETSCGEKSIIYTILNLASEVCNIVKKIDKKEENNNLLRREMKNYKFISGRWE